MSTLLDSNYLGWLTPVYEQIAKKKKDESEEVIPIAAPRNAMEVDVQSEIRGGAAVAESAANGRVPSVLAPEPARLDARGSPHAIGSIVVLHGLTSRKDLLGQRASVLSWTAQTTRLGVKIETSGERVLVRPGNVRPSIFSTTGVGVMDPR